MSSFLCEDGAGMCSINFAGMVGVGDETVSQCNSLMQITSEQGGPQSGFFQIL